MTRYDVAKCKNKYEENLQNKVGKREIKSEKNDMLN